VEGEGAAAGGGKKKKRSEIQPRQTSDRGSLDSSDAEASLEESKG